MAILNTTPDSFSDGSLHTYNNVSTIKAKVSKWILAGADIIDIGGQSTRPKADLLSPEEELQRVIPIVEAIRAMPEAENVAISIDTFYAEVARQSILAGADIINDVSAGLLDKNMFSTVAELGKTIILMHMRGDPQTMSKLTQYPNGIINGVTQELSERVAAARDAGIAPWRIILDPGIGFAKTQSQNLELLRNLRQLRENMESSQSPSRFPWLVGTSRKGFVGKITGAQQADQRAFGTAATVTASIQGGAEIIRVHDVEEMIQVTKMADAIYRQS
jgi:2-amino-4-hydroxy-6-hydroxymethyldihydropteridine diphosphokinase/dihydropteroate synthase